MSNPTRQQTPITNAGLSSNTQHEPKAQTQNIDDTKVTVHTFLDQIALAKSQGEEWVETSPEIISHYNRSGLGGAKFFVFQGVKVCPFGQKNAIEAELNQPLATRLHGGQEGKLLFKA